MLFIMLAILDCGVRINELLNVKIEDYNSIDRIIKINSETAKARKSMILHLSSKTAKYLRKLIKIAEDNYEEYIFCSSYGDKIQILNIIKTLRSTVRELELPISRQHLTNIEEHSL